VGHKILVLSGQSLSEDDRALADQVWGSARDALNRVSSL
jgi:hypothetical protein